MRFFGYLCFFLFTCVLFWRPYVVHAASTLTQNAYRFYVNTNSDTPTDPWPSGGVDLGENTSIGANDSGPKNGDVVRIRLSVAASGETQATGLTLKLQFGQGSTCSSIGTWTDVGAFGSGTIWRGYNNATPADGGTLPTLKLAPSDVAESYEEENNTASSPTAIAVGQDGEWDFVVEDNSAPQGVTYCFRVVQSDGTTLNSYTDYPKLTTYSYIPKSQNWRWYDDENNATPSNPLAPENSKPIGVRNGNLLKLRTTIKETNNFAGTNVKMKWQFSTSSTFSTDVNDVIESGSCTDTSRWCYADGANVNDNDAIATRVLSDSTASATHNESSVSSSTYTHSANTASEWEVTIKNSGAVNGTTYYFRPFDLSGNVAVPLDTAETYPFLQVFNTILSFSVSGIGSSVSLEGVTTTDASTATSLPFGTLVPNQAKIMAQRLTVTADGVSYRVLIKTDGELRTIGGLTILGIDGTNALPVPWGYKISDTQTGVFGYHTGDDVLAEGSTRFQANDTWAKLETTEREIVYTGSPVENEATDVVFKIEISGIQSGGSYSNEILYITVPTY